MVRFFLKLFMTVSCLIFFKTTVWSVEQTVVYFAFQYGIQDTGSPAPVVGQTDSYLSTLETKHGSLKGNRQVSPKVLSFDFYKTNGSVASGFGLEVHSYKKNILLKTTPLRSIFLQ